MVGVWKAEVLEALEDLKDTAESLKEKCAGLTCCQIWDKDEAPLSIFIVNLGNEKETRWQEFINPVVKTSGRTVKLKEKCLSVGNVGYNTKRESNVTITYNVLGSVEPITTKLYGSVSFLPIVLQHEYDHINGKLIFK